MSYALLVLVPLSLLLNYVLGVAPIWSFVTGAAAIAVLSDWIRRATDQLAQQVGPAIGGLLTISFGSIAELVLAIFVLRRGELEVVQAQITGSIIGTSLFGLGLAILAGGVMRAEQTFNSARAGLLSTMLVLVLIALLLPAIFDYAGRLSGQTPRLGITDEEFSIGASVVLLLIYAGNLAYTLVTHRAMFSAAGEPEGETRWNLPTALGILIGATVAVAIEAEIVSASLEATAKVLSLSPQFIGVIALALVGTAADIFAATWFARRNAMDLAVSICVGSAIQVALVVAPLLVIISALMQQPLTLVFSNPIYLFAIAATAFIVTAITRDGRTTWFEGWSLVGVYVLFGLAFFFSGAG